MDSKIKVRFAPSPTGILHVGGIRTALFNYFFAKSQNGEFVLRNEDTDQARKVEGSVEATLESLTWLGVDWDDFITQSERLQNYQTFAQELVAKGQAKEEEGAVRFITPKIGTTSWHDQIGSKEISFENCDIEDFIILKKDGYPTYHLANVIDDHLMEITHVIRGEDWIPSAPKHLMLYAAFGWIPPVFAHVPNVMGTDGKKLSKRRDAKSVLDFRNEGYLSEALLNYLMLLGWSPKNDREILSKKEITENFSLDNINSAPAIFDERKLLWMNGEYIRSLTRGDLIAKLREFDPEFMQIVDNMNLLDVVDIAQTRIKTLYEFRQFVQQFITPNIEGFSEEDKELRLKITNVLSEIQKWDKENILTALMDNFISKGIKFQSIYKAVIGVDRGLPIADFFEILGKEKTLELLK